MYCKFVFLLKKTKIFVLAVFLICSNCSLSYSQTSLKHIKGAMTVSGGGLVGDHLVGGFLGESLWLSTKASWDLRLDFLTGFSGFTDINKIGLENQLSFNFVGISNVFYIDGLLGFMIGIDNLKSQIEEKNNNFFLLTGDVGLKAKYYFNYKWSVWAEYKWCLGLSKTGSYMQLGTLGVSWMLPGINNKSSRKF